jgi:ABC-2 type transport system permease protein
VIYRMLTIVVKELDDVRRSRLILTTLIVPTVLYVALSVVVLRAGSLIGLDSMSGGDLDVLGRSFARGSTATTGADAFQALLVDQILVLFMLAPLFIPLTIASYSIIGEKQLRTLEPLLATPVRTWELLAAKAVAAVLPGVLVSWSSYAAFILLAGLSVSTTTMRLALAPVWIVSFGVLAPLFALLAVGLAVIASSRTSDPRAAQQLGAVVILPISAMLSAQVFGFIRLDISHALTLSVGALVADLALLWAAVRLFNRETILTRWR